MNINSIFNALNESKDKKENNEDYNYKVTDTGNTEKVKEPGNKIDKEHKEMLKKNRKDSYKQNMETIDDEEDENDVEVSKEADPVQLSDDEILKLKDILKALKVPESIENALDDGEYEEVYEFLEDKYNIRFDEREEVVEEETEEVEEDEDINEAEDWKVVADTLVNPVEDGLVDEEEFIKDMARQTDYSEEELRKIYRAYWEVNPVDRMKNLSKDKEMKKWLGSQLESNKSEDKEEEIKEEKDNDIFGLKDEVRIAVMEDGFATSDTRKWDLSLTVFEGGKDDVEFNILDINEDNIVKLNMVLEDENIDRDVYMEEEEVKKILE